MATATSLARKTWASSKTAPKQTATRNLGAKTSTARKGRSKVASDRAAAAPKAVKPGATPKRDKLVRDGFTIPKSEFAVLQALKARAGELGRSGTKKSEVLRAGIKALAAMTDAAFLKAMRTVPLIKTGRPAKSE